VQQQQHHQLEIQRERWTRQTHPERRTRTSAPAWSTQRQRHTQTPNTSQIRAQNRTQNPCEHVRTCALEGDSGIARRTGWKKQRVYLITGSITTATSISAFHNHQIERHTNNFNVERTRHGRVWQLKPPCLIGGGQGWHGESFDCTHDPVRACAATPQPKPFLTVTPTLQ
jgi:hypothetical protein